MGGSGDDEPEFDFGFGAAVSLFMAFLFLVSMAALMSDNGVLRVLGYIATPITLLLLLSALFMTPVLRWLTLVFAPVVFISFLRGDVSQLKYVGAVGLVWYVLWVAMLFSGRKSGSETESETSESEEEEDRLVKAVDECLSERPLTGATDTVFRRCICEKLCCAGGEDCPDWCGRVEFKCPGGGFREVSDK